MEVNMMMMIMMSITEEKKWQSDSILVQIAGYGFHGRNMLD